jgi:hypothetical protein
VQYAVKLEHRADSIYYSNVFNKLALKTDAVFTKQYAVKLEHQADAIFYSEIYYKTILIY